MTFRTREQRNRAREEQKRLQEEERKREEEKEKELHNGSAAAEGAEEEDNDLPNGELNPIGDFDFDSLLGKDKRHSRSGSGSRAATDDWEEEGTEEENPQANISLNTTNRKKTPSSDSSGTEDPALVPSTSASRMEIDRTDSSLVVIPRDPRRQQLTTPCLLYTSPSPRDLSTSRMPSSA